jgi:hypothetical protein
VNRKRLHTLEVLRSRNFMATPPPAGGYAQWATGIQL